MMNVLRLVTSLQHAAHEGVGEDPLANFSQLPADHHVTAPSGAYEYVLVVVGVIITVLLAVFTIKFFVKPGETAPGHIKRKILTGDR